MKRIFLLLAIIVCACSSDDDTVLLPQTTNFYALTVGNSWDYKFYELDENINEFVFNGKTESRTIVSLEDFFGDTYYKLKIINSDADGIETERFMFIREYDGSLIDVDNKVIFVNNDYSERILLDYNDWALSEVLSEETENITVEAGNFDCLVSSHKFIDSQGEIMPYNRRNYYSDGIGQVLHIYGPPPVGTSTVITLTEKRLDSYIIN